MFFHNDLKLIYRFYDVFVVRSPPFPTIRNGERNPIFRTPPTRKSYKNGLFFIFFSKKATAGQGTGHGIQAVSCDAQPSIARSHFRLTGYGHIRKSSRYPPDAKQGARRIVGHPVLFSVSVARTFCPDNGSTEYSNKRPIQRKRLSAKTHSARSICRRAQTPAPARSPARISSQSAARCRPADIPRRDNRTESRDCRSWVCHRRFRSGPTFCCFPVHRQG